MKHSLVPLLACPECGGKLRLAEFATTEELNDRREKILDVDEGVLICACQRVYPIIQGVPRMLEGALSVQKEFLARWAKELHDCGALTAKALEPPSKEFLQFIQPTLKRFEKEWAEHKVQQTTWGLDQSIRLAHSLQYLGWSRDEIKGKLVLDAGAGTGQLTCSMTTLGCEIVGIDLSPAVVRGWKLRPIYAKQYQTKVHIVQGNLMKPPLAQEAFDGVMSQGVLHHTPNTRQAFDALVPTVRKGGVLGVWLYHKGDGYIPLIPFVKARWAMVRTSTLRKVTPKMPPSLLYCLLLVHATIFHVFYSASAFIRRRRHNQTIKERATSLFDSLAPPYVYRHTPQEVIGWFKEMGFIDIRDTSTSNDLANHYGFCITGTRA